MIKIHKNYRYIEKRKKKKKNGYKIQNIIGLCSKNRAEQTHKEQ